MHYPIQIQVLTIHPVPCHSLIPSLRKTYIQTVSDQFQHPNAPLLSPAPAFYNPKRKDVFRVCLCVPTQFRGVP